LPARGRLDPFALGCEVSGEDKGAVTDDESIYQGRSTPKYRQTQDAVALRERRPRPFLHLDFPCGQAHGSSIALPAPDHDPFDDGLAAVGKVLLGHPRGRPS